MVPQDLARGAGKGVSGAHWSDEVLVSKADLEEQARRTSELEQQVGPCGVCIIMTHQNSHFCWRNKHEKEIVMLFIKNSVFFPFVVVNILSLHTHAHTHTNARTHTNTNPTCPPFLFTSPVQVKEATRQSEYALRLKELEAAQQLRALREELSAQLAAERGRVEAAVQARAAGEAACGARLTQAEAEHSVRLAGRMTGDGWCRGG